MYINILFILAFILLEIIYSYIFIWRADSAFSSALMSAAHLCFLGLANAFFIFLVPFQLHKLHLPRSAPCPKFFPFVQKTVNPVIIATLKAFFITMGYLIVCGAVLGVICAFLLYPAFPSLFQSFFQVMKFEPQSVFDFIKLAPLYLIINIIMFPAFTRYVQFHFIPYVIFFNSEYAKTKQTLKLSIQLSKRLSLPIFLIIFLCSAPAGAYMYYVYRHKEKILEDINITNLLVFSTTSFISCSLAVFTFAVYYFLYKSKDSQYLS